MTGVGPEAVRKPVTILFCDVVESTAIAERVDPEALGQVMMAYFSAMKDILARHGGVVEKYIGDAVMAVFGFPRVHEDDALRASRAALDMREALGELNEGFTTRWGITLQTRTGVNTGEVVAASSTRDHTLPLGDPANVAARLQAAAPPGDIYLGKSTWMLVRHHVEADPVEPLSLKGKSQAMPAWRLVGVVADEDASRGRSAPLVGRAGELERIRASFDRACEERRARVVLLIGEPGVGKSRLAAEFGASVRDEARVLGGHCLSSGGGLSFWPIAEILRAATGVAPGSGPDALSAALGRLVPAGEGLESRLEAIVGIGPARFPLEEVYWASRRVFEALSEAAPLVLILEDLHWADGSLIELLQHLAVAAAGPILILCTARPEISNQWTESPAEVAGDSLALEPLSEDSVKKLLDRRLGGLRGSEPILARIAALSEGNPLFAEQIADHLVEESLLERREGQWVLSRSLEQIAIPDTISSLLAARLDRLFPADRTVVGAAAVAGVTFPRDGLVQLVPVSLREDLDHSLGRLIHDGFVLEDLLQAPGRYRFRHALIQDAAYTGMLKETRAQLHQRYADWIEGSGGDPLEIPELAGHHLDQAHRLVTELSPTDSRLPELAARAGRHLVRAGRLAMDRGDARAAVSRLGRGSAFLEGEAEQATALLDLADCCFAVGLFKDSQTAVARALAIADDLDDALITARGRLMALQLRLQLDPEGLAERLRDEAESLLDAFAESEDEAGLARAWRMIAISAGFLCHEAERGRGLERAIVHAGKAGNRWLVGQLRAEYVSACVNGPMPVDEAVERCQHILPLLAEAKRSEAVLKMELAELRGMQGRLADARALFGEGWSALRDLGLEFEASGYRMVLGRIEGQADDHLAAEHEFRQGFEELDSMGERSYASSIGGLLGVELVELGRLQEAEHFAAVARDYAAQEDLYSQVQWRRVAARVAAEKSEGEEGLGLAAEAVRLAQTTDWLNLIGDARMDLGWVLHRTGRRAEGVRVMLEAVDAYIRKGNQASADRAHAALDRAGKTGSSPVLSPGPGPHAAT